MIPISTYFIKNSIVILLSIIVMIADILWMNYVLDKDMKERYKVYARRYREKVEKLKSIIENDPFNIQDKNGIEKLVQQCDEELSKRYKAQILIQPFNSVMSTIFIPLISIAFATYLNNIAALEIYYVISGLISIGVALLIIYYAVGSTVFDIVQSKKDSILEVKQMLNDILILGSDGG